MTQTKVKVFVLLRNSINAIYILSAVNLVMRIVYWFFLVSHFLIVAVVSILPLLLFEVNGLCVLTSLFQRIVRAFLLYQ